MKFIQMSLLASTIVLFTACGGGDDNESYVPQSFTGQFVDTYVKGLNYTCTGKVWDADGQETGDTRTTSGVTNDKGEFTCAEGDVVEFSIGSYVIGATYAYNNTIKSPYDLSLGSETAIINVAQLLQTIDDKSIDGVLTIPDNFTALNGVTTTVRDDDFDALMADALNVASLVSEEVAQAHLDETLSSISDDTTDLSALLAGKTVYIPYDDEGGQNIGIWEFSADGTELTWTEDFTVTESISFDGNIIKVDNNDGTFTTIEATNIAADRIDVTFTDGGVEYLTLYFDRADAEATFL